MQWRCGECDGDVESVMEMWGVWWRCGECDGDVGSVMEMCLLCGQQLQPVDPPGSGGIKGLDQNLQCAS